MELNNWPYNGVKHRLQTPTLARKFYFSHWFPGGADGRTYGHVIIKVSRMDRFQNLWVYGIWMRMQMQNGIVYSEWFTFMYNTLWCDVLKYPVLQDEGDIITVFWYNCVKKNCVFVLKKEENSITRKLRNIFRAPNENRPHDPPSSNSDDLQGL